MEASVLLSTKYQTNENGLNKNLRLEIEKAFVGCKREYRYILPVLILVLTE